MNSRPALHGALLALLAAALFGLSTPFLQKLGRDVGPFTTSALLYAGAALVALVTRSGALRESSIQRSDWPRLFGMTLFGAVIGPVALAWGLQRTSGTSASLMLTLEAFFTIMLARKLYGESIDRRVAVAMVLLLCGGILLAWDQGQLGNAQFLGFIAVLVATIAWGIDNTLSRGVAERDPAQVVLFKSAFGAAVSLALALVARESIPKTASALGLLAVGATGFGLSLRFYLLAQRSFGAARTGSVFAFAPFIGAFGAFALGERSSSGLLFVAGVLMLVGIMVHLAEKHEHTHTHETITHEHAHTHDDAHHNHRHNPTPADSHSHPHTHEPLAHAHPHVPDAHHLHVH